MQEPESDRIYLITVTDYGQDDNRRRALEAGFGTHMTKPIDLNELKIPLERIKTGT